MTSDPDQSTLWTWPALIDACAGRRAGQVDAQPEISRIVTDSRTVVPGDLFVALPGDPGPRFHPSARSDVDGHDFVRDALDRGAAGAVVRRVPDDARHGALIEVEDTYDALWGIGRAGRARLTGSVVAVTGSSGKTTAKHFLAAALDGYMPPGSFNNHIGVPLALGNAPALSETAIFEIGTSHPGEIAPLAHMTAPDVAIVLNVGVAHLENFPSKHDLMKEKLSIFNALKDKSKAIYRYGLPVDVGVSFGAEAGADARLLRLDGDLAEVRLFGESVTARVPMGGLHRAETMLACLLTAKLLDRPLDGALNLSPLAIPAGRGTVHAVGGVTVTDDAYNANPDSMRATLTTFLSGRDTAGNDTSAQRHVLVLGEMLELGDIGAEAHAEIAGLAQSADVAVLVGAGFEAAARAAGLTWFREADQACLAWLQGEIQAGDRVLVKGSNRVFWAVGFVGDLLQALRTQH